MTKKFNPECLWFFVAVFGLATLLCIAGCASIPGDKPRLSESRPDQTTAAEKLGIKPVAIRLTAGGNMVDFRYSVFEPSKSLPMFDRKIRTYLVNEATGDKFAVPTNSKIGPLRSSSREPVAGKEYFIFFVNPGRPLKRGDKVAVVVGDMKIENLTLE